MSTYTLYRFYDDTGVLLYVGITADISQRLIQHHNRPWFHRIHHDTLTAYPTRIAAIDAERTAIATESPLYNKSPSHAGGSILSWAQVREIRTRLAAGEDPQILSLDYGVLPGTIRDIQTYKTWKESPSTERNPLP